MSYYVLFLGSHLSNTSRVQKQLDKAGLTYDFQELYNLEQLEDLIHENRSAIDAILYDKDNSSTDFEKIIATVQGAKFSPPLIVLTEELTTESATDMIRSGASDIITRSDFNRLGQALLKECLHSQSTHASSHQSAFQVLLEQIEELLIIINEDWGIEYSTPAVRKMLGQASPESKEISLKELIHPDDLFLFQETFNKSIAEPGKMVSSPPLRIKESDESWRWFKSEFTDLRNAPTVNGIVINLKDIHSRITESHINKLIINNTEEGFLLLDRNLILQKCNELFRTNYRKIYDREVHIGDHILEYASTERHSMLNDLYERVLGGETVEKDFSVRTRNGNTRFFDFKYKPAFDEENNVTGIFIAILETTQEQLAKKELAQSKARFKALVENGGDIQLILENTGTPKYASPSIFNVLGYNEEEALNLDIFSIIHAEDIPLVKNQIDQSQGHPGVPLEVAPIRIKAKHNEWHWFEGTVTNLFDDTAVDGIVCNLREVTGRVKAEEVTLKAKNQYQSLIQTIDGVVWESDPYTLEVNYISPQSLEMFGYDADEWKKTPGFWLDKLHPDDRKKVNEKYAREIAAANNHELEYRFKTADGSYMWIRDIISIITDEGSPVTVRGMMTDITEEKNLELKLEQAYELSEIGSWKFEVENDVIYLSEYVRKLYEIAEDQKVDLDMALSFYTKGWSLERISHVLEKAINEGIPFDEELPIKTAQGNKRWVRVVGKPEFENGKCTLIYGNTQNITERKTAQLEKQEAEKKYRNVVEHSTNMFYQHDTKGVLSYVSPQSLKFLGYPPEKAMRNWTDFITDHPKNALGEKITQKAIDTGVVQPPYELQLKTGDDRIIWVEVHEAPIIEQGEVTGIVGSLTDITERKQYEIQTKLQYEASLFFKEKNNLNTTLENLLEYLAEYNAFSIAEIWLKSSNQDHLNLISTFGRTEDGRNFFQYSSNITRFKFGEGLPGTAWSSKNIEVWDNLPQRKDFKRHQAAKESDIHSACALPLFYNSNPIGVIVFGSSEDAESIQGKIKPYEILQDYLGAEIRRKQQEEELLLLFESSPDILAILAEDEKFVRVNPAFVDILGYTEEELTSQPYTNFVHPDDLTKSNMEFIDTISGQRTAHNFINRLISKSGEIKYISWSTSEVFGEDNFLFCFGRDVTERMELEDLLNEVQRMAKIGGWEMDVVNDKLYWSAITKEIYEVAPDFKPKKESITEFIESSEHKDRMNDVLALAMEDGTPWDEEVLIYTATGQEKWIRSKGKAEFLNGRCIRLYGSVQDIHNKKEAEINVQRTLQEKESILESIGDGFFTLDDHWNVTYWNRAAEQLLQTPKQNILNQNLWDVFEHLIERPTYTHYHRVMHQKKAASFEDYYTNLDKWFDINAYPSSEGISVFFKDITERKKAQAQLRQLNRELEARAQELAASNEELEQFAYVASHDLQEPLRMVTSFLTQLDKKYGDQLDEKANKYIHFAVDGAQRMRQIILDLLNYSRLNQDIYKREAVDLNLIIEEAKKLEHSHIMETGAIIISDPMPTIQANPNTITHVFQNLLNNALKYQQPGITPEIEIRCFELDSHWKFMVRDNGIGIKEEFIDSIFQIFKRLHTRDVYSGTGIGLAISKKVIERHGGDIWAESEEGVGSSFYFTIKKV